MGQPGNTQALTATEDALALFDSLEPVSTEFMIGAWRGEGFPTHHPLDGVLEAFHWHGKRFDSREHVHPLVFRQRNGELTTVNPMYMLPALGVLNRMPFLKSPGSGNLFRAVMGLFATGRSRARLRMTEYRGKSSATMIYDALPINDVFRKLDDDRVLGIMDLKGVRQPFFFVLRRE